MADILNSTVYETDDILAIIKATQVYMQANKLKVDSYAGPKIRYMNQKYQSWNATTADQSFARVFNDRWHRKDMEVCILRPSKIEINALIALAEAADADDADYCAPQKVTNDVIGAIWDALIDRFLRYSENADTIREKGIKALKTQGLKVRINPKAKGRKAYTLENLQKTLRGRKNNLANQQGKLRVARGKVTRLEAKIPTIQASIKKMEANVAEREKELGK